MPIYEYACDDCQKKFEAFVGIHDAAVQECSHCAGHNIRKLISNCSFQLKGTGWYVTDYARKDSAKDSEGKQASAAEPTTQDSADHAAGSSDTAKKSSDTDTPKTASDEKAA